jgi:hypothetical protein
VFCRKGWLETQLVSITPVKAAFLDFSTRNRLLSFRQDVPRRIGPFEPIEQPLFLGRAKHGVLWAEAFGAAIRGDVTAA